MHVVARETRHPSLRSDGAAACAASPTPNEVPLGAMVATVEQIGMGEATAAMTGSAHGVLMRAQKVAELHMATLLAARAVIKRADMSWGLFTCTDRTNIGEYRNVQAIVSVIGAARMVPRSSKMVVKARVVGLQMARGVAKFVHWLYAVIWTANGTEAARQVSLLAMTMVVA